MSASVATHKDTGLVPEAELARRKRDVRGRAGSAGFSPDAQKADEEAIATGNAHQRPVPPDETFKSLFIAELIEKFIRKRGSQWCVVSKKGKNLGCSDSKAGAAKRLAQVEYFKRHKSLTDEGAAAGLDSGALQVSDVALKSWMDLEEKRMEFKALTTKHFPSAPCPKCGSTAIDEHIGRGTHKCKECGAEYQPQEEKHLPGKHDQASHGGDESGQLDANIARFEKLSGKKVVGSHMSTDGKSAKIRTDDGKTYDLEYKKGGWSFKSLVEKKHLPGQHDQSSHAGAGGAAGKVAHTPAQLRDAAARQHAKDEGISIAAARKRVGSGAKVPTTRMSHNEYLDMDEGELASRRKSIEEQLRFYQASAAGEFAGMTADDISEARERVAGLGKELGKIKIAMGKSIVSKADQTCLKSIWGHYYKYYSGKWIAAAWGLYQKGQYAQAAQAFGKARDGFQPDKNPNEYECLDAWSKDAEGKGGGEQKAGTSEGSKKGHRAMGHKVGGAPAAGGGGKDAERRNDLKLARRQMEQRGREYDAANAQFESAKAKGVAGPELDKLFQEAKQSWEAYADARKGFSQIKYQSKTLVTKAEMAERNPVRFAAPMVNLDWVITKARTLPDGTMEWTATTTKFARDVQRDLVRRAFYEDAIKRFKSKTVPPPFVSVAHYRAAETCLDCGHVYKSLADYICPTCKAERVLAGVCTDMWIDGRQPKARGVFYPTEVGRAAFESVLLDIKKSLPLDERNRVSMGFYPDVPEGIIYSQAGRDFVAGWCEHFALTRVPVVAETDITARMVH